MSDTVTVLLAVISIVPSSLAAILGFMTKAHLAETRDAMNKLEVNTNSKLDQLVKVTGEAEHAKGRLEGIESTTTEPKPDPAI